MIATSEWCSLPLAERLQLVGELWNSIAENQDCLPDSPEVVSEVLARQARFRADPASGVSWEEAKAQIRTGCV